MTARTTRATTQIMMSTTASRISPCFIPSNRVDLSDQSLPDLDIREQIALWPPAVAALVMGVAPLLWLNAIDPAVQVALASLAQLASRVVGR